MAKASGAVSPLLFSVTQVAKLISFSRTKTYQMV
jgi:hypothetical protein